MKHIRTVGIRALKQNASAVVAEAAGGESIVITDRGRVVAQLIPAHGGQASRLEAAGRLRVRKSSFKELGPVPRPTRGRKTLSAVLRELRDSERF